MTKEELKAKLNELSESGEIDAPFFLTQKSLTPIANISIQYAISVLENVRDNLVESFMDKAAKTVEVEIDNLKSLLNSK